MKNDPWWLNVGPGEEDDEDDEDDEAACTFGAVSQMTQGTHLGWTWDAHGWKFP